MSNDYGGRVDRQRLFDHFPGVDAGAVYGAPEQLLEQDDAVSVVEVQATKQLVAEMLQAGLQVGFGICGAADEVAASFEQETARSIDAQRVIEASDELSFDQYLHNFFSQYEALKS